MSLLFYSIFRPCAINKCKERIKKLWKTKGKFLFTFQLLFHWNYLHFVHEELQLNTLLCAHRHSCLWCARHQLVLFVNWCPDCVQIFDGHFRNFLHLIEENFFPELLNASELNSGSMDMSSYDGSQSPRSGGAMTPNSRNKRMRTSFKHHQLRTMKSYFAINQNPDAKDLKQLAQKTGLSKRVLQVSKQTFLIRFFNN